VKHGVNVVLAGTIAQQGGRFDVSVKAIRAVTGELIKTTSERASQKADILAAATKAAFTIRTALGDNPSDTAQRFAMETLSSRSIEAVREYAKGMEALSRSQFEDALKGFRQAVALDPSFGTAYGAMAMTSKNLDRLQDAVQYANEAMKYLSGMTEREAFRARGHYYFLTNDYEKCVKEYGDLLAQWSGPGDAAARNNRALCLTSLRKLANAVDEMKELVRQVPGKALYQDNLALYLAYNGEFAAAEDQVKAMKDPGLFALLGRAYAELGQGRLADAARTYESFPAVDKEEGPSYTAAGLGDLAIHEGRYNDAVKRLSAAAVAHEKAAIPQPDKAANKYIAVANANLLRGQKALAIAAAQKALDNSQAVKIRFLAARVMIEAGAAARAEKIAAGLGELLQAEPQAYNSHLEGLRAMAAGNYRQAVKNLEEATAHFETWIGHFDLGRAYLASKAYAQADIEFDRCAKRKGEALSLFLDEEPTFGYFPAVHYYLGQAREGLKNPTFADSYRAYLQIRGKSTEDGLVADARKRAGPQ
jgi:tetratricopeptide (TPR) repeat protein